MSLAYNVFPKGVRARLTTCSHALPWRSWTVARQSCLLRRPVLLDSSNNDVNRSRTQEKHEVRVFQQRMRANVREQLQRVVDTVRPGILFKVLRFVGETG